MKDVPEAIETAWKIESTAGTMDIMLRACFWCGPFWDLTAVAVVVANAGTLGVIRAHVCGITGAGCWRAHAGEPLTRVTGSQLASFDQTFAGLPPASSSGH